MELYTYCKKSDLQFTKEQMVAVVNLVLTMTNADGVVEPAEIKSAMVYFNNFGISYDAFKEMVDFEIKADKVVDTVKAMNTEQKKFLTGLIGVVMFADSKVDEKEKKLFTLICDVAKLPSMTVTEALEYMSSL